MRVVVIGGTGAFAGRVTQDCLAAGDEVLVVSRGRRGLPAEGGPTAQVTSAHPVTRDPADPAGSGVGSGVESDSGSGVESSPSSSPSPSPSAAPGTGRLTWLQADRADLAAHAGALRDFAPDAVVDAICFDGAQAHQLVDLFPAAGRIVMISTVDVYGGEIGAEPVTEERPPAPETPYAIGKLAAEQLLRSELGDRVAIIRPTHMLGRGFLTAGPWGRTEHVVARLRAGLPVLVLDGGRGLVTPVYAGDVAAWTRAALAEPRAGGEVFNAVGAEITTMRRYLEAIAAHLGVTPTLVPIASTLVQEALGTATQFAYHLPYSCAKAVRLLGHRPTGTLASMLAETVDAMPVRRLGVDGDLPVPLVAASRAEDELTALLHRQSRELAAALVATDPR